MEELAAIEPDVAPETTVDPDDELISALNEGHEPEVETTEKFKVKVNGEERELTREEALNRLQKELAADQKFEEAAKLRKEAEDAIANRERYTQHQQLLQQAIEQFQAQAQIWASEGMPTQEQLAQLLEENPHEYLKWQTKIQQRTAQLQQAQAAQAYLQQQHTQEQAQMRERQRIELANGLPDVIPEWKDTTVAERELTDIRDYIKNEGYNDQEWQNLCHSKPKNFAMIRKSMLYDRLIDKANKAKAKPVATETEATPIKMLGSKASASTVKSIFDPNLSDEEYSKLRRQQRRKS